MPHDDASSTEPWLQMSDQQGNQLTRMPDLVAAGANAALFENGKVLLQKRADNGQWGLPGGRMEIGESVEACAVREMLEETGLETRATRLVGVYSNPVNHSILSYPNGAVVQYVILLYAVERTGGELAVSPESTDVGFFDVDRLPEPLSPAARLRINDALTDQSTPFSR